MKHLAIFILGMVLSSLASTEECSVDLNYNIRVSSEFLEVSDASEVQYLIRQGGLLSVKGVPVVLNEEQKTLAENYAGEVGALVPQWILLVSNALGVAEEAIRVAFGAAFGDDSEAAKKSTQALASARERFENSSNVEDGVYSIMVDSFGGVDGAFDEEFSEEIEDAVMASIGTIFLQVGKALLSSDEEFEGSMEAFGERMDRMGEELEGMGEALEETAQELCNGVHKVQRLEKQLAEEIPQLANYPLFES